MNCQQRELIPDYLEDNLPEEAAESFERHLEECDCCVSALAASEQSGRVPEWLLSAQKRVGEGKLRNLMDPGMDGVDSGVDDGESLPPDQATAFRVEPAAPDADSVRYSWKRRIGSGGMGEVWEGWDHLMRRPVALKRLRHHSHDFEGVQRLLQEATTLSRLSCPHIVTVYGVVADHVRPVLVMEFIPGMTLSEWQDGRPLRQKDAAEVVLILAQALQHAHAQGVIHRDLKPSNILLRTDSTTDLPRDERGVLQIWLSDFGLARFTDDPSLTQSGQLLGTPVYMAPEQLGGGHAADCRTDIYGLGAVLYELLTGIPPFMGNDSVALMQLIRTQEPVSPRRLQPQLSRDIETICLKCLSRRPAERYATSAALAADLQAFIAGLPIAARPVSLPVRLLRWSDRNRALAVTLSGAVLALLIALLLGLFAVREQGRTLTLQRQAAVHERQLRLRAEVAEKDAKERSRAESQLRSKHEALLLQMVRTVENQLRIPVSPTATVGSAENPGKLDSGFLTTQVITEYLQSLKQLNQPLSWTELELMIRLLSLKIITLDASGISPLISRIDEALVVHEIQPVNPLDYVEFLKIRQMLFSETDNTLQQREDQRQRWLAIARRFLDAARRCEPNSVEVTRFLDARCEALMQAFEFGKLSDQYPANARDQQVAHLRLLKAILSEPTPASANPRNAERELLTIIENALREYVP